MRPVYSRRGSDRVRLSVYVLSADIWWISINHFRTFRCFNVTANHNLYCCQIRERKRFGYFALTKAFYSLPE